MFKDTTELSSKPTYAVNPAGANLETDNHLVNDDERQREVFYNAADTGRGSLVLSDAKEAATERKKLVR